MKGSDLDFATASFMFVCFTVVMLQRWQSLLTDGQTDGQNIWKHLAEYSDPLLWKFFLRLVSPGPRCAMMTHRHTRWKHYQSRQSQLVINSSYSSITTWYLHSPGLNYVLVHCGSTPSCVVSSTNCSSVLPHGRRVEKMWCEWGKIFLRFQSHTAAFCTWRSRDTQLRA